MTVNLSQDQARTIAVASQGLDVHAASIEQVFAHVKCLQVDPLKAIRESHELVCLSRGATLHDAKTLLATPPSYQVFAYPAHAMAMVPMHLWPWFAFRRRKLRANGWRGPLVDSESIKTVTSLLNERNVVTTKDFADGTGTGWQRISPLRIAADWLLWIGDAVSTSRIGTYREYALAAKVVPLSPFDSLVWYRPRLQRLFGKAYLLEAYKPAAKRTFGHYFVPILVGNRIVGRVSPRRSKGTLIIEAQEFDSPAYQIQAQDAMQLLHVWSDAGIFQPFAEPKAICAP